MVNILKQILEELKKISKLLRHNNEMVYFELQNKYNIIDWEEYDK